jgi:TolA-binding protein
MLTPKKKISRKEIKQDELLNVYVKASSFYYANKRYVSYAVTGIVVVVVATLIFINNRRASNEKAATELGKVYGLYDQASTPAQYQLAIDGQRERGLMGLKTIVDNYGNTDSGELARFYLGNAYYNVGKYDEALQQFGSFSSSTKLLQASAQAGIGSCYEAKGEYGKAAGAYEKASGMVSNEITTPEYLNSAARCYGRSGEKDKAIAILKRLKLEYPNSQQARDVDRYISEFSA